jgi:hypothetical protein
MYKCEGPSCAMKQTTDKEGSERRGVLGVRGFTYDVVYNSLMCELVRLTNICRNVCMSCYCSVCTIFLPVMYHYEQCSTRECWICTGLPAVAQLVLLLGSWLQLLRVVCRAQMYALQANSSRFVITSVRQQLGGAWSHDDEQVQRTLQLTSCASGLHTLD